MNKNEQEFLVQKIRTQYTEREHTQLDELKKLDSRVKKPVNIFSCAFGAVSALIMGSGMSLIMTDVGTAVGIEDAMVPGIVTGIAGMLLALVNYPLYKMILSGRKKKYADRIIAVSDEILKG